MNATGNCSGVVFGGDCISRSCISAYSGLLPTADWQMFALIGTLRVERVERVEPVDVLRVFALCPLARAAVTQENALSVLSSRLRPSEID